MLGAECTGDISLYLSLSPDLSLTTQVFLPTCTLDQLRTAGEDAGNQVKLRPALLPQFDFPPTSRTLIKR